MIYRAKLVRGLFDINDENVYSADNFPQTHLICKIGYKPTSLHYMKKNSV